MSLERVDFPPNWRPQPGDRASYVTSDHWPTILAENSLLRRENAYLLATIDELEEAPLSRRAATATLGGGIGRQRREELEQALADILAFVLRLSESPMGPVLRRWPGYRVLEDRYLDAAKARYRNGVG